MKKALPAITQSAPIKITKIRKKVSETFFTADDLKLYIDGGRRNICASGNYTIVKEVPDDMLFSDNCTFDDNCKFGEFCKFGESCVFGDNSIFDQCCYFKKWCRFGNHNIFLTGYGEFGDSFEDNCMFGNACEFEDYSTFGDNCRFGKGCKFGVGCRFGTNCKFGDNCTFGNYCYVEKNKELKGWTSLPGDGHDNRIYFFHLTDGRIYIRFGFFCGYEDRYIQKVCKLFSGTPYKKMFLTKLKLAHSILLKYE